MDRFADLPTSLYTSLTTFREHPFPHVPDPPGSKKRASVALIIRIRPNFDHEPSPSSFTAHQGDDALSTFFSEDWVKHGSPEVLFIKRIDRSGDRWSGHVALPGGRRDPEDESDLAAAIRETSEEVGLDLTSEECITVGNLPERVVSTTWGKQVLMVICPYIFLWTSPKSPALKLQPTEIAATHWVPLAALLSPALRSQQLADFSGRLAYGHGALFKAFIQSLPVGNMLFSAIRLIPSESLFSISTSDFVPPPSTSKVMNTLSTLRETLRPLLTRSFNPQPASLQLWGLTLGILADFLDQFPPHDAVKLWTYPTFTPLDLQFLIWIVTYDKRKQNARNLNDGTRDIPTVGGKAKGPPRRRPSTGEANQTAVDVTSAAIAGKDEPTPGGNQNHNAPSVSHATGLLLEGYYDRMKYALVLFTIWRVTASVLAVRWAFKWWRARKSTH